MKTAAWLRSFTKPALLAGALLLLAAPAAFAQGPRLTDHVTDQTGVLGSGAAKVETAVATLSSTANVDLWVLFVSTTGGSTAPQYATETFDSNGFGGNDMLLVVAVDDHRYAWAQQNAVSLSDDQLTALASGSLDSRFKAGDYAGGVVAFADALMGAIKQGVAPTAAPAATGSGSGSTTGSSGSGDLGTLLVFFGIIGAIFVALVVLAGFRAWRLSKLTAEERDKQTGELARQANKLLVDTDDAITSAKQELGFAQAEFSDTDTAPFAAALDTAAGELKQAFTLRQQLDDSTPDDPPTRIRMYQGIIAHCQAAAADIDVQEKRIEAMRNLEETAPQALNNLDGAIDDLQARLPAVKAAMQTLSGYAPSGWAAVKGNPEEADTRGAFAEAQIKRGKAALAQTPPSKRDAASAAQAAQEAVAQANQLLDSVENQARALEDAKSKVAAELAAAQADIATATASAAAGPADPGLAGQLAQAATLLNQATAQASAAAPDPIAALIAAQTAHATADSVLAGQRQAADLLARNQAAFASARASAMSSITRADGFVSARRSAIGQQARTRLVEAQRHLAQGDAVAASDLVAATNEARTADSLADDAYNSALSDVGETGFSATTDPGSGGYGGMSRPAPGGGTNIGGSVLGGIIGGMLTGGGNRRGGGFGGTTWGSGGGWTGGGHSGGSSSFGGTHSGGSSFGGFGGSHGGGGGGTHSGGGGW